MRRQGALTPYLFLLPGLLLFAVFRLYPLLDGLRLSFTNARLGRAQYAWVGFANYERLLDDTRFHTSLWNTALYSVASTLPVLAIPLAAILAGQLLRLNLAGIGAALLPAGHSQVSVSASSGGRAATAALAVSAIYAVLIIALLAGAITRFTREEF